MSSLLGEQEDETSLSSAIVDAADTNGDGTVSLEEMAAALGAESAELSDAFSSLDTDGDGQLTTAEIDSGLKANAPARRGPPPPPQASDVALDVLAAADGDKSGALSLSEVARALDVEEASLAESFASLDADADGALGSEELTSAIQSVFARREAAYAASTTAAGSTYAVAA
jgi:Ca2+-binding EF-hand superfamily protein